MSAVPGPPQPPAAGRRDGLADRRHGTPEDPPGPWRQKPGLVRASLKYALVGGSGVVVNLVVLHLLHAELGLGFTRSSALATELAIVTNYLGNEFWTFHHRRLSLRRLVQFNLAALFSLVVTVTLATVVKEFVHPLLAQLAGIAAGASLNFGVNFWWTWRR